MTGALCLRDGGTKFAFVEVAEIVLLRNRSYEVAGLGGQAVFCHELWALQIGRARKWDVREPSSIQPCPSGAVASKPD